MLDKNKFVGVWKIKHHDKNGNLIGIYDIFNAVVTAGVNHILDVEFNGASQSSSWYVGLVGTWTAFNSADTLAVHAGWLEATPYAGGRPQWTVGGAAARAITNPVTVDFAITSGATLKGIFICDAATGTVGTLWSEAAFSLAANVNIGDILKVTYTLSIP